MSILLDLGLFRVVRVKKGYAYYGKKEKTYKLEMQMNADAMRGESWSELESITPYLLQPFIQEMLDKQKKLEEKLKEILENK